MVVITTTPTESLERPQLFPLPSWTIYDGVVRFAKFGPDELGMIQATNVSLLGEDDPVRFLLELGLRPELQETAPNVRESTRQAYRAGVLLGAAVMRDHIAKVWSTDEEEGFRLSTPDRQELELATAILPQAIPRERTPDYVANELRWHERTYKFLPFMRESDVHSAHSVITFIWSLEREELAAVLSPEARAGGDDEIVATGMSDAFRVYAHLTGEAEQIQPERVEFDPEKHLVHIDVKGWDYAGRPLTLEEPVEPPDLETGAKLSIGPRRISAGFTTDQGEQAWNEFVPAGGRLTEVRRFQSGTVMPLDGDESTLIQIGFKDTLERFELADDDVLVARGGPNYRFFTLPATSEITPDMVSQGSKGIQLAALCRNGDVILLTDTTWLDGGIVYELGQRVEEVVSAQQDVLE